MKKDHRMGKGSVGIFKIYSNVPFLHSLFLSLSLLFSFFSSQSRLPGTSFGQIIAQPISGILSESDFLGGWPSTFYLFGE